MGRARNEDGQGASQGSGAFQRASPLGLCGVWALLLTPLGFLEPLILHLSYPTAPHHRPVGTLLALSDLCSIIY